jgi:Rieske Fe-S protein
MLIADQLLGRPNPWRSLYDPARRASSQFNRGGESQSRVRGVEQIERDSGGVVTRGRQRIAVWRSAEGALHAVSARCTHMGCTVTWNNAQHTWDCPCHGSVFARDGSVLHGPAVEPLKPLRVPKHAVQRPRQT